VTTVSITCSEQKRNKSPSHSDTTARPLTVSVNDFIAVIAHISEQLVVVRLTIRVSILLVVFLAEEWLFTLSAHEVLHVPVTTT